MHQNEDIEDKLCHVLCNLMEAKHHFWPCMVWNGIHLGWNAPMGNGRICTVYEISTQRKIIFLVFFQMSFQQLIYLESCLFHGILILMNWQVQYRRQRKGLTLESIWKLKEIGPLQWFRMRINHTSFVTAAIARQLVVVRFFKILIILCGLHEYYLL